MLPITWAIILNPAITVHQVEVLLESSLDYVAHILFLFPFLRAFTSVAGGHTPWIEVKHGFELEALRFVPAHKLDGAVLAEHILSAIDRRS